MSRKIHGAVAALLVLGLAPLARADTQTVDLSPYVNQSFANSQWFIDGATFANDLPGTSFGNQGSTVAFNVANVADGNGGFNNFWFGLDDGTHSNNLFGPQGSVTVAVGVAGVQTVYTLAANTFGTYENGEFSVTFHGAGGDLVGTYIGGFDTRDYNTPNCFTTGCTPYLTATPWYNDGSGIVLDMVTWSLPQNFGLTSMTFDQLDPTNGFILAGVSVGVPEPAAWALMIMGFGLAGASLRRRRIATA